MPTSFVTERIPRWPKLAWVAECRAGQPVHVRHGRWVEAREHWFGEITWDGEFESGDFDRAEHAFGSGGRQRNAGLTFVSSSSVLDRLHWFQRGATAWVSNSLPGIMSATGLKAFELRRNYPSIFRSICRGVENYQKRVPMEGGDVLLAYMKNLVWDGNRLHEVAKPRPRRELQNYSDYLEQVLDCLGKLGKNWQSPSRSVPFSPLSTISTGYDSPTATVLGRAAGLRETLSISSGRSGASDDGSEISRMLGLTPHVIGREDWRAMEYPEIPFLASDAKGEDVYFSGARELLERRVLLTGYGGTRVWGTKPNLCQEYQRGDQSGLSHTEARLHLGYLHIPVPMIVANQPGAMRRISASDEMQPWHVTGSYNCPIARRIVEDAGVKRRLFGMEKKAASVLLYDRQSFLTHRSLADFQTWLHQRSGGFQAHLNGCRDRLLAAACQLVRRGQQGATTLAGFAPSRQIGRIAKSSRLQELASYQPQFAYLFPWAVERAVRAYESH